MFPKMLKALSIMPLIEFTFGERTAFIGHLFCASPDAIFLTYLTRFMLLTALSGKYYSYHCLGVEETLTQPLPLARNAPGREP